MKNLTLSIIVWCFLGLLLAGQALLNQPYAGWAGRCFVIWLAGCVAYNFSIRSNKDTPDLVKSASVTCLIIGGICFMLRGSESRDEYGDLVAEGFETTFNERAGTGVRVFAGLFIGALGGVLLASHKRQLK